MQEKSQIQKCLHKNLTFKAFLTALTHEQTLQTLFLWRNRIFWLKFIKDSQKNVAWLDNFVDRLKKICPQGKIFFFSFFSQKGRKNTLIRQTISKALKWRKNPKFQSFCPKTLQPRLCWQPWHMNKHSKHCFCEEIELFDWNS